MLGMDLAGPVREAQKTHRKAVASTYPRYHNQHRYNLARDWLCKGGQRNSWYWGMWYLGCQVTHADASWLAIWIKLGSDPTPC